MKKNLLIVTVFTLIITLLSFANFDAPSDRFPSHIAYKSIEGTLRGGPIEPDEHFLHPTRCAGCHGYDSLHIANIDADGNDINLVDDWETSMMGLAGKDPLWLAKVRHESLVNPAHAGELQNLCTSCHAPMGHYKAFFNGLAPYSLANLATDSLGQAGVACMGCHSIKDENLGSRFTGDIPYDTNHVAYGPFVGVMEGPMQLYVGILPMYSPHVSEGRFCSPCHTLISNTVDLSGNPTGGTFVEQATYHEWLNSSYPALDKSCQKCHMPQIEEPVKIAVGYTAIPGRTPFNQHKFTGANSYMVNLIKNNKTTLGISARDVNFDETLRDITDNLKNNTVNLEVSFISQASDSINFEVKLENKAGHKFPSGYPSRRAILQFVVVKENGDTLFASGKFNNAGEMLQTPSSGYEPHHNFINSQNQSQIYEMVMGDVSGNKTTVLERSSILLKDNRLVPKGFSTSHYTYDTVKMDALANADSDFNKNAGIQGTGSDIVHFQIPLNGYVGKVHTYASMHYVVLPPSFLTEMFSWLGSSTEIDAFNAMYIASDKAPVQIAIDSIKNINIINSVLDISLSNSISVFPNPTLDGAVYIESKTSAIMGIQVFNSKGQLVLNINSKSNLKSQKILLPDEKGLYYINIITQKGNISKKLLRI
jgi:hypothetical protein